MKYKEDLNGDSGHHSFIEMFNVTNQRAFFKRILILTELEEN